MGEWVISKDIEFCYGHRVHNQNHNEQYSLSNYMKCRHLHGHQGKVTAYLRGTELKDGMVTDFLNLNWLKKFLDDYLDHKFILDLNDPLFDAITSIEGSTLSKDKFAPVTLDVAPDAVIGWIPKWAQESHYSEDNEFIGGFFFVDFVPTSENLAKWLFDVVDTVMRPLGIEVSGIDWQETPKSVARYRK